jgi:uncharacterized protein YydD (DUF2326 family)
VSLDELRADLKRNVAEASRLTTVAEIREHFINTLWPFIEAQLDVVEEMDDAVAELVDQTEDYLQSETAGIFAALVQSSLALSAELRKRAAGDELLVKRIDAHDQLCQQAMATLGEITMIAPDGDEPDDEEEDDDAEDEDEADA